MKVAVVAVVAVVEACTTLPLTASYSFALGI